MYSAAELAFPVVVFTRVELAHEWRQVLLAGAHVVLDEKTVGILNVRVRGV